MMDPSRLQVYKPILTIHFIGGYWLGVFLQGQELAVVKKATMGLVRRWHSSLTLFTPQMLLVEKHVLLENASIV